MQIKQVWLMMTAAVMTVQLAVGGDVVGTVKFDGEKPTMKRLRMDADPKCAEMHEDEPPVSEEVVINDNGTLRNVFVYVRGGLEGKTFEPSKEPVELRQEGCLYRPRVFGMMARQPLRIHNDDDTLHNVHALAKVNKEFNIGQPNKGMVTTRTFAQPEVMIKFKCDVHPWMAAYVGVLPHPFYDTTGEEGTYRLKGLPAGEYEIVAWHEKFGEQVAKVAVGADGEVTQDFTFKASGE